MSMKKASDINKLIVKHDDNIDRINDSIMDRQFQPIPSVYIDLPCLKDIRLGLMLHLSTPETFSYIKEGLERYNKRPNRSFKFAYPDFPYSEEDLQAKLSDPELSRDIFNRSPDTELMRSFTTTLAQVQFQNKKASYKLPVMLNVNIWPLTPSDLSTKFGEILQRQFDPEDFVVKIISTDPITLPSYFWNQQGLLFIDDMKRLCQEDSTLHIPLLIERRFLNKMIFAALQAGDEELEVWRNEGVDFSDMEKVMDRFELTAIFFSLCCLFSFTPFIIPIPKK